MAETSKIQIRSILLLNLLNWDHDEIAAEVGVSKSTVSKYVNKVEDESKRDGVDPYALAYSYLGDGELARLAGSYRSSVLGGE